MSPSKSKPQSKPLKTEPDPKVSAPEEPYVSKVDRRTAMAWVGVVGAVLAGGAGVVVYGEYREGNQPPKGYGTDPKLTKPEKAPWPRIMTAAQLQAAALMSDYILPASGDAPAATALGVPDFLNEWVSAPYPDQIKDRAIILDGLEALQMNSRRRWGVDFNGASAGQRLALLQTLAQAKPKSSARIFFRRMRSLVVGAYYTTPQGFKDIGYIGNVPRTSDPGPSAEVKAHLDRAFQKLGL
jgi:hypothetical protein